MISIINVRQIFKKQINQEGSEHFFMAPQLVLNITFVLVTKS